ncbi:MAG: prepilin-type N-terminal cleavage/methylation domain-containing protein [Alteromonadaceae bacterium]|nr:prepilin-type N-terminal cleavage/methylation domain-containing protein [Alteromonadaceae bacterium]
MKRKQQKQQHIKMVKGFTLIELMIALMIIVGLTITLWPQIEQAMGIGDAAKARVQISEIQNGAGLFKQRNNVFTGVSMSVLDAQGYVSDRMADGTARNPWGGNYAISVVTEDTTQYMVTVSGIKNSDIGAQLAADYATSAVSATFSESNLTLIFQG